MQSEDTTVDAERLRFDLFRSMTPADKLEMVRALCRQANGLALAGLRLRYPQASERELSERLRDLRLGPELAALARHGRDG